MSLALSLANRLILDNTQHEIDPEDRKRVAITCGRDEIEAWVTTSENPQVDVFCLKFPGTGGRAENSGPHPCEIISDEFECWTINPPGYGTSTGKACVQKMAATCDSAWQAVYQRANGKPIMAAGNSLGCMYALYVAARFPVSGVLLRNPAPIHQLIRERYSWWNFGLANRWIASQVSTEMDSVVNAARCMAPALFVCSEKDRMIPPRIQEKVINAYAGPFSRFMIVDGDHDTPVPEQQVEQYRLAVEKWGRLVLDSAEPNPG